MIGRRWRRAREWFAGFAALAIGEVGLAVSGVFVGAMAASFAGGVLAVGWEADEVRAPVELVREAIDGNVLVPDGPTSPSSSSTLRPPPPSVGPDRR